MIAISIEYDRCDIKDREEIQSEAYKLCYRSLNYHEAQYYLDLACEQVRSEHIVADNNKWYQREWIISEDRCSIKDRQKIKLRVSKLRQQSPDYHEEQYYLNLANHQIRREHLIANKYKWYSPRKWKSLIWKNYSESYKNLERLATITAILTFVFFLSGERERHEENITNAMARLLEQIDKPKPQNIIIGRDLQRLNRRDLAPANFFNPLGFARLAINTLSQKKIYVYDNETRGCKKILEIELFFPRWESAGFAALELPKGVNLSGIILCDADLKHSILNKVILDYAMLAGAYLFEAKLIDTKLRDSDLRESSLLSADLTGADLTGADLTGADLTEAKLTCTTITSEEKPEPKTEERCTNLTSANLTDANLNTADLKGANLKGANLKGASLDKIEVNNLKMSQLKLACNWDKANYIFRQTEDEKWEVDVKENQKYIEDIRNDKASNPQTRVDRCSQWN